MDSKFIGFVGVESYDVVHLLGNVLLGLGYKLTVVDCSQFGDIVYTVPGYTTDMTQIDYNNLTIYRAGSVNQIKLAEFVLIYFGMNTKHPDIKKCDELWIYTDSQLHKLNALSRLAINKEQPRFVVFRDRQLTRATKELILDIMKPLNVRDSNFIELDDDVQSLDIQFRIQYDSKILFKGVTSNVTDLVINILESDFELKDIKKSLKEVLNRR